MPMMPDLTENICEILLNCWNIPTSDNYRDLLHKFYQNLVDLLNIQSHQEIIQALQYTFPEAYCDCSSKEYQENLKKEGILVDDRLIKIQNMYMQTKIGTHNHHLISNNIILFALSINSGDIAEILLKKCIEIYNNPITSIEEQDQIKKIINYQNKFGWGLVIMTSVLSECRCTSSVDHIWRILLDNQEKFDINFTTPVNIGPRYLECNLPLFAYAHHGGMWGVFDELQSLSRSDMVENLFKATIKYFDNQDGGRSRQEEFIAINIYKALNAISDRTFKAKCVNLMREKFIKYQTVIEDNDEVSSSVSIARPSF